jgi:CRP-like cAMP-binding protein
MLVPELMPEEGPLLRAIPFEPGAARGPVQLLTRRQQMQIASIATQLRLPARMVVYREESAAEWIFIVVSGVVKSFRDLSSGKRRVMAFLFARDIFGLAERGHYVNTTQAVTPVTLYRIELATLAAMFRRDAELQFQFLCKVTHELREALHLRIVVGRRDAVGRVAMFLKMLEDETVQQRGHAPHIDIPMSRSDTANYLGLSLEAVSRACRTLDRTGIVAFDDLHSARIISRSRFDKLASAL